MRFEVFVVFLLEASLSTAYESDGEEIYHDGRSDVLEEQVRPRRSGALDTASDGPLQPADVDIVKGVVQQLLSETESDDVGPSNSTRSPLPPVDALNATSITLAVDRPQLIDASNEAANATTSSYTTPATTEDDYEDEDAEEETTVALKITTSLYTELSAGLDDVGAVPTTKVPPLRTPTDASTRRTAPTLRTDSDVTRTTKHSISDSVAPHMRVASNTPLAQFANSRRITRTTTTTSTAKTTTDTTDFESTTQDNEEYYEIEIVRAGTIDNTTDGTDSGSIAQYDEETIPRAGKVISKCFVCGLEEEGIPGDAHCSDAFAADLLPLAPVDPAARGYLPEYRKYCKLSPDRAGADDRSVLGAWTGGCSVRWVDLSGVYTQRACRRRDQPVMGRHYVSKRMAKLEKALRKVDSGCIASPAATLVPFSRTVSLYARVHVCVCAENWCNRAARPLAPRPLAPRLAWLLPALAYVTHS